MTLDIKNSMSGFAAPGGTSIKFRIGLDCDLLVAGVIGKRKFIYDLWGNAVNTANRTETTGMSQEIHCTDNFKKSLDNKYQFVSRGLIEVKGKGMMQTWLLNRKTV